MAREKEGKETAEVLICRALGGFLASIDTALPIYGERLADLEGSAARKAIKNLSYRDHGLLAWTKLQGN